MESAWYQSFQGGNSVFLLLWDGLYLPRDRPDKRSMLKILLHPLFYPLKTYFAGYTLGSCEGFRQAGTKVGSIVPGTNIIAPNV
jgi:hypothetical protein